MLPLRTCRLAVLLLVLPLLLLAGPAAAHESDPRLVTVLDARDPALPDQVVVQVQAGIATQLVASNPTAEGLEVLGTGGRPFLRLSSAGVFADLGSEDFSTTSNPNGAAPTAGADGPARWVQISAGDSWGWYDHRLHPAELRAPADATREAELAEFEVPLRYGRQEASVAGRVLFRPLLGSLLVAAGPAPEGVAAQALPGRLPGLFLSRTGNEPVTVLGRDGEPFLRLTDAGVEVNERSRTHVEDRQARGQAAGPPSPEPAFRLVAPGASSYTWLDARLRYPADLPPEEVLRADGPTVVHEWAVPVLVGGAPAALTGEVSWLPEADAARLVGGRSAGTATKAGPPLPLLLGLGAVLVLGASVLLLRRARPAQPAAPADVPAHTDRTHRSSGREERPPAS